MEAACEMPCIIAGLRLFCDCATSVTICWHFWTAQGVTSVKLNPSIQGFYDLGPMLKDLGVWKDIKTNLLLYWSQFLMQETNTGVAAMCCNCPKCKNPPQHQVASMFFFYFSLFFTWFLIVCSFIFSLLCHVRSHWATNIQEVRHTET